MRSLIAACCFAAALIAPPAAAEVTAASPGLFIVSATADIRAPPQRVWEALGAPGLWWNSSHTYSGDANRLLLDLRAGGCWCESWGEGQSVEHMRVVLVMESGGARTLRMVGGLGPLQDMGVNGVMTYTLAPHGDGAQLTMTYRVTGDSGLALDQIAPVVDGVLMEQFRRLVRYSETGAAE